jgi:hypothetical protein
MRYPNDDDSLKPKSKASPKLTYRFLLPQNREAGSLFPAGPLALKAILAGIVVEILEFSVAEPQNNFLSFS